MLLKIHSCHREWPFDPVLVFNSGFGRLMHWLRSRGIWRTIEIIFKLFSSVLISGNVCRSPSWTPKTQPGGGLVFPTKRLLHKGRLVWFLIFSLINYSSLLKRGSNYLKKPFKVLLLLVRLQNIPAVEDHVYTRVVWSKAREINKWLVRNDETFAIFFYQ